MTLIFTNNPATFGVTTPPPFDPVAITGTTIGAAAATTQTIDWDVAPDAQGQVEYGTTVGYGSVSVLETNYLAHHTQVLQGLTQGTQYHFRVKAISVTGIAYYTGDFTFTTSAVVIPPGGFPPESNVFVTTAPPAMVVPAVGVQFSLPAPFVTKGMRVTSVSGDRHKYSRMGTWSKDETWFATMPNNSWPVKFFDGHTFAFIKSSQSPPPDWSWSFTDDNLMYGGDASSSLVQFNVSTGVRSTVHTFSGYSGIRTGYDEGQQSQDDRYFLCGGSPSGGGWDAMVYDKTGNTVVSTKHFSTTCGQFGMSASGAYYILNWNTSGSSTTTGTWVYNRDGTNGRLVTSQGGSHAEVGFFADGVTDCYVTAGGPRSYRLSDLTSYLLFPASMGSNNLNQNHLSMRNFKDPGWVLVSEFDGYSSSKGGSAQAMVVKVDGSGIYRRFGWLYSPNNTQPSYSHQPQACISPSGTRVVTAADWGSLSNVYDLVLGMDTSA